MTYNVAYLSQAKHYNMQVYNKTKFSNEELIRLIWEVNKYVDWPSCVNSMYYYRVTCNCLISYIQKQTKHLA